VPVGWRILACSSMVIGLAGCGIQPTGVVDAGGPAAGIQTGDRVVFLKGGQLQPVLRARAEGVPVDTVNRAPALRRLIDALAAGPTAEERGAGIYTEIPAQTTGVVEADSDSAVLSGAYRDSALSPQARFQLSCTAASLFPDVPGRVQVDFVDSEQRLDRLPDCPPAVRLAMRAG
jgi:hypothetical protein